jgi:hypothetical protein
MRRSVRTHRRTFLEQAAALALVCGRTAPGEAVRQPEDDPTASPNAEQIRDYLRPLLPAREDVAQWLAGRAFPFSKYDAELGYLHIDRDFAEGQDGAVCQYRYDARGARRMMAYAELPCRINTYGNSFTSCEQVNDGETWQEVLARHLGEPPRNHGIGGYSVYQAYLRMLREEQRAPARYIVFNIFDDDHARNLHGWQRLKFGVNRKSINPTVPHVAVDMAEGQIADRPNPCPTPESVCRLCDLGHAYELFAQDFALRHRVLLAVRRASGQPVPPTDYDDERLMRPAIFATTRIIDRVREFAQAHGKQVLFVLSYGAYTLRQFIEAGKRFDQALVDRLDALGVPYVDLMQAHAQDAARYRGSTDECLARYFIGHYNPLGNVFCAFAMKNALLNLLDPKPPAYRR